MVSGEASFVGSDAAVGDDVAGGLVGGGARLRGEIAGGELVELGVVEDGLGVAEDEVDGAFDVGVEVVLAAVVGEEGVLVAEDAAVLEDGAVGADGDGDGLTGVAGGVLKGQVVGLEAGSVDADGLGEKGSAGLFGVHGICDDDVFGSLAFADEGDVGVVLRDDDALMVDSRFNFDVDASSSSGEGVVVHGHLDGRELVCAFDAGLDVVGDANVNVLGEGNGGKKARGDDQNNWQDQSHG